MARRPWYTFDDFKAAVTDLQLADTFMRDAEQRGYDRAIAEVVAWLRVQQHGRTSDTFPGYYARAIEAGEHKP